MNRLVSARPGTTGRALRSGLVACVAVLVGCSSGGGGGGSTPPAPTHFSISGAVTGAAGVTLELSGVGTTATTTTDTNGNYTFAGLANGTYTVVPGKRDHAMSPARLDVVVSGASVTARDFAATVLASYDPLTADTLDALRWQTPEYVRTISNGKALLSVRAEGMQSNLVQGISYTSAISVAATGGGRVTTFQADVTVPASTVTRTGSATVVGGLRLYYQPSGNRNLAFPGALQNELIAALELYDGGSGLKVRRRFNHCDDAACITLGGTGITFSDPVGFTGTGTSATAAAAFDTTYTFTLALNEATGVFTWTVQGGAFGAPGVSGTVDVSSWASAAGATFASSTDGFLSAQLHARTSDASVSGGGTGAVTATFDNVMVGTNGAAATLYDDFATLGSSTATGFSQARWGAAAGATAVPSGGKVHLSAGVTTSDAAGASAVTTLAAMYATTVSAWQADVAIVDDVAGGTGSNSVRIGGAFLNDGTAGAAHDATGDVVSEVIVRTGAASISIMRCLNATCSILAALSQQALTPDGAHPLGLGTVHAAFQQWDPVSRTFTYRLDDGPLLQVSPALSTFAPPRVPSRHVRATLGVPFGAPAGTAAHVEATVANVRAAR